MSKKIFIVVLCFILFSCVKNESATKVIGGQNVDNVTQFASVVAINVWTDNDKVHESCTASIVSHNTLLTAAHCVMMKKDNTIWYGKKVEAQYIDFDIGQVKTATSSKIFYNKNYKIGSFETSPNDMAIVVFDDNTFSKLTPITLYPKTIEVGSSVAVVGYGCETEVKERAVNGHYKKVVQCVELPEGAIRQASKKAGVNTVTSGGCYQGMVQITQKKAKVDNEISDPTGVDVSTSQGDSGGPLLNFPDGGIQSPEDLLVTGIASYGVDDYIDYRYSCYSNPILGANYQVMSEVVNNNGAKIPGINMYVGMIELNGKVRVVEKQRKNIYNEKMPDTPFTISSIQSGDKRCQSVGSTSSIKSCWDSLTLLEKTKLTWE